MIDNILNYIYHLNEVQVISLIPSDKSNFVSHFYKLSEYLFGEKDVAFNDRRILTLLNSLKDDVLFLLEFPYIDEIFRDSYYLYYAEKFLEYKRNSIRVHIFSESVDNKNFSEKQNAYLGYFIIRPLKQYVLGHSFISQERSKIIIFCAVLEKRLCIY